jgi:CubicO group peptidase (beta-lactamase class C family)
MDDSADLRSQITLRDLLAIKSGVSVKAGRGCSLEKRSSISECAQTYYEENVTFEPGTHFYYGPAHLHLAAAMAEEATQEDFTSLFEEEVAQVVGMKEGATFRKPSDEHPNPAGGAYLSADDYEKFLLAMLRGEILSASHDEMHRDHTPIGEVIIEESPVSDQDLAWHYGLGNWKECPHEKWADECDGQRVHSSPGAFGFYPWVDFESETWGIVAVKDLIGASKKTVPIGMEIRPLLARALAP